MPGSLFASVCNKGERFEKYVVGGKGGDTFEGKFKMIENCIQCDRK